MKQHKEVFSVLFVMRIDPKKVSTPETTFAWMDDENTIDSKEDEILFTMPTVSG